MDAEDRYNALAWAVSKLETTPGPMLYIDRLYMMHLRDMLAEAKREAGR